MDRQQHFDCDFPWLKGEIAKLTEVLTIYVAQNPERNERRAQAVRLRLGLDSGEFLTFKKVGKAMGLSSSRADELYYEARREIKHFSSI